MSSKRKAEAIWIESKAYWQIKVQKDGVRKAFTSSVKGRKGKHEAEAKADNWLDKGTSDMRFPLAWDAFLTNLKARSSTTNYASHESNGRLYVTPIIGNKKVSSITPIHWQSCIDAAARKGLSRRSCKNVKSTIVAFLHFAKRARLEVQMLEDGDVVIPNSAAPEKEKNILQPDDIRTLFSNDAITKWGKPVIAHYIYAWRMFVATGMRRGELCGLHNEDVTDTEIHIKRSINKFEEVTHGKNDNARRTIRLSQLMSQILEDQKEYLKSIGVSSQWVFPDEHGERADPKIITNRWKVYRKQYGFKSSIHELRHTFVSINKSALPIEMMKSVIGHSTKMDTYGIYGHDVEGERKIASDIIDDVFAQVLKKDPKVGG